MLRVKNLTAALRGSDRVTWARHVETSGAERRASEIHLSPLPPIPLLFLVSDARRASSPYASLYAYIHICMYVCMYTTREGKRWCARTSRRGATNGRAYVRRNVLLQNAYSRARILLADFPSCPRAIPYASLPLPPHPAFFILARGGHNLSFLSLILYSLSFISRGRA